VLLKNIFRPQVTGVPPDVLPPYRRDLGPGRPCQFSRGHAPLGHTRTQQRFELSFSAVKVVHHHPDAVRSRGTLSARGVPVGHAGRPPEAGIYGLQQPVRFLQVRYGFFPHRPSAYAYVAGTAGPRGGPARANASRYEARTLDFWVWNSASVITPRSFRSASLLSWSALLSCGTTL
jgi:hypothetical protein